MGGINCWRRIFWNIWNDICFIWLFWICWNLIPTLSASCCWVIPTCCCWPVERPCDEVKKFKGIFWGWDIPSVCGEEVRAEFPLEIPAPLAGGSSWLGCVCIPWGCIATNDSVEVRLCACMFLAFEVDPFDRRGPWIPKLPIWTWPPISHHMCGKKKKMLTRRLQVNRTTTTTHTSC